jgi:hypothetical protein
MYKEFAIGEALTHGYAGSFSEVTGIGLRLWSTLKEEIGSRSLVDVAGVERRTI